jgi:hypothetical protein
MKSMLSVHPFRALLGVLCGLWSMNALHGQETKPAATGQAQATITKSLNDFLTFNGDAAQHDRFWAEDLVYTSSAGLVKTKADIMQGFADAAKAGASKAEPRTIYSAEDILVRVYGETAALTFRLVARNADGTTATYRNSGTLLHRKGTWQVVTWQATKETFAATK